MRKVVLLFVVLFSVGSFAQNSKLKGYNSVCKNPIYLKALGGTFEVGVNIGSVIKLPFILDAGKYSFIYSGADEFICTDSYEVLKEKLKNLFSFNDFMN